MTNLAEIVVKADFKKEIVIKTHSLEMGLKKRERERGLVTSFTFLGSLATNIH